MNINSSIFAFVFGIIFLASALCIACIRLRRISRNPNMFNILAGFPPPPHDGAAIPEGSVEVTVAEYGLDESTLNGYPKLLYSEMIKSSDSNNDPSNSSCSICLGDYKETDTLRLLPDCGHLYHLNCVDPWLKLHPTCPICRSSSSVKAHPSNSSMEGTQ